MKKDLTLIVMLADISGSMCDKLEDAIGGMDYFINSQKDFEGETLVTLNFFDDGYKGIFKNKPIKEVTSIRDYGYCARGNTALYDAIAKTIDDVGEDLNNLKEEERPQKVIIVIQTDGQENYSREYTSNKPIKAKIEHQQDKYNWEFVFLGEGVEKDVKNEALNLGINLKNVVNYDTARGVDTTSAYMTCSSVVDSLRTDD